MATFTEEDGRLTYVRPADAPLRIIADLHAAYGNGVALRIERRASWDRAVLVGDTLHAAQGLWLTFYHGHLGDHVEIDSGISPARVEEDLVTAVEAARVWLHKHGGTR